jgi:hypothetical protein
MERLINSDSTVTQLWGPITLRDPEDGGDMFAETSVITRATRYNVPGSIPDDSVHRPYKVPLYGETDQQ